MLQLLLPILLRYRSDITTTKLRDSKERDGLQLRNSTPCDTLHKILIAIKLVV